MVPGCTNADMFSTMENILDPKLCREGTMMYEKVVWTQATSATAELQRRAQASSRGLGRAARLAERCMSGLEVGVACSVKRIGSSCGKRRDNSLSHLQGPVQSSQ